MTDQLRVYPQSKSLGTIIHRLDSLLSLALERAFQSNGFNVTSEQWGVLSKLWESDGIHQAELAEKVNKDKHNITRILNLLEKNGFVKRVRDTGDRRLSKVYLTERGRFLKGKLPPVAKKVLLSAVGKLGHEEIEALWRILPVMVDNLETVRGRK